MATFILRGKVVARLGTWSCSCTGFARDVDNDVRMPDIYRLCGHLSKLTYGQILQVLEVVCVVILPRNLIIQITLVKSVSLFPRKKGRLGLRIKCLKNQKEKRKSTYQWVFLSQCFCRGGRGEGGGGVL